MARIFLSYRRDDTAGHTGRIFDHLSERFGTGRVFIDVEGIEAGENFATAIEERIKDCDTLVAVIGKGWAAVDPSGLRRLDDPGDYVRQEIEAAFRLGVDVVPVLVGGAGVPARRDLPESLSQLSLLNALEIDDRAFLQGTERLILILEKTTARALERRRLEKPARNKPARNAPEVAITDAAVAAPSERSALRRNVERLLLLYSPSHPATWIVHVLFYFGLFVLAVAPLTMAQMGERGGAVAIAAAYLGILAVLRAIAAAVEPSATTNAFRHWWLLYKAPRTGTTVLHVLFFLMLLVTGLMTMSLPPAIASQPSDLARLMFVDAVVVLIILTFAIREIAAARDPLRPAGVERTWFARLFYIWSPRRAGVWLPRLLWYVGAFLLLLLCPQIFADSDGNLRLAAVAENGGAISHAVLLLAVAISARGWVRSLEVSRLRALDSTSGSRLRQFLPPWVPSKAMGWVPIAMFWISSVLAVATLVRRDVALPLLGLPDTNAYYIAGLAAVIAVGAGRWARVFYRADVLVEDQQGTAGV